MNGLKLSAILLVSKAHFLQASPTYADLIPNGYSVPNPDPQGGIWAGVGHTSAGGGGDRNPFGVDFAAEGHAWTKALCEMDSDGDGRSNGIELGDPECVWVVGVDPVGPALSHPGIEDEPIENPNLSTCVDYVEPEEIEIMDVSFTQVNTVDESQTHYICEQYEYDVSSLTEDVYHLVKTEILLDNPALLHHAFVYICPEGTMSTDGDRVGEGSYSCYGSTENSCRRVGGWAVGGTGFCYPQQVGDELIIGGAEKLVVKLEAHYDNALGQPQSDQSGMKLTLTPNLRPLVSNTVLLGMGTPDKDFVIPPQSEDHVLTNICPSEVTSLLDHPIYAFSFAPHMHNYGKTLYTEHWRCGVKIGEIGRIENYDFDNQQTYGITEPAKILPGDALVTKCHYNTIGEDSIITGGEETRDEMCLDFVRYYPQPEGRPTFLSSCISFLNGIIHENPMLADIKVATSDMMNLSADTVIFDFDENPAASWAPCCDTGDCEEQYRKMAVAGVACGVDQDCAEGLSCQGGLCSDSDTEDEDKEPPSDTEEDDNGDMGSPNDPPADDSLAGSPTSHGGVRQSSPVAALVKRVFM